jgi:putative protease
MKMRKVELLAPAKNLECGIEAVKHGADAVYIGAPKFGARAAAGNSLQDIEQLVSYAHRFNARVYVALNTILTDKELDEAQQLIWDLYHAGADAIIAQDMGILQLDLPPIALHASTQTDNRSLEKVQFLEKAGFSQIVLARELSLDAITEIASQVQTPLEVFVHGALCVSYSGQCYLSEALSGRSANRGECAQCCRLPYNLVDTEGNILAKNQYLLSLKDLNLSDYLSELLDAGVSSLKIEGRLKDVTYVKNVTAFYRKR